MSEDNFNLGEEEQHRRKLSGEQRERHERIVEAGLNKFSATKAAGSPKQEDLVVSKMQDIHNKVMSAMRPILEESHKKGIHDRQADRVMLASFYLQQLDANFDKDELTFLLTSLIVEQVFQKL